MYTGLRSPIFVGTFLFVVVVAITFAFAPWQVQQTGPTQTEGAQKEAWPPDAQAGLAGAAAGTSGPAIESEKGVPLAEALQSDDAGTLASQRTASSEPLEENEPVDGDTKEHGEAEVAEAGTATGEAVELPAKEEDAETGGKAAERETGLGEGRQEEAGEAKEPVGARTQGDREEEGTEAEDEESGQEKNESKEEREEGEEKEGSKEASDRAENGGKGVLQQDVDGEAADIKKAGRSHGKLSGKSAADEEEETEGEDDTSQSRATGVSESEESSSADTASQDTRAVQGDAETADVEVDGSTIASEEGASPASRLRGPRGKFLRPGTGTGRGNGRSRQPQEGSSEGGDTPQDGDTSVEQEQEQEKDTAAGSQAKEESAGAAEGSEEDEVAEEAQGEGVKAGKGEATEGGGAKAGEEGEDKGALEKGDDGAEVETGEAPKGKATRGKGTEEAPEDEELAKGEASEEGRGKGDAPEESGAEEGKDTESRGEEGEEDSRGKGAEEAKVEEQGEQEPEKEAEKEPEKEAEDDGGADIKVLKQEKKGGQQGTRKRTSTGDGEEEEEGSEVVAGRPSGTGRPGSQGEADEEQDEPEQDEAPVPQKKPTKPGRGQSASLLRGGSSPKAQKAQEALTEGTDTGADEGDAGIEAETAGGQGKAEEAEGGGEVRTEPKGAGGADTSDWIHMGPGDAAAADMLAAAGPASAELATEAVDGSGGGGSRLGVQEAKAVEEKVLDAQEMMAADSNKNETVPRVAGKVEVSEADVGEMALSVAPQDSVDYQWPSCGEGREDWIPCLDNEEAIRKLRSTKHYQHRERHCPSGEHMERCLPPLPKGYQQPIAWPKSRDRVWFSNVPHPGLAQYKKQQNWVHVKGDKLVFPGGGTQFVHGAGRYIISILKSVPEVAWGNRTRVMLDMGCGVASLSAYLEPYDVHVVSMAPKDEHEAQVQLALERGILALLGVMGTQRLPFPANAIDVVHCSRCRVPWHKDDGMLLLEVNRILRPGGYFVWSATPVYRTGEADTKIWEAMEDLTSRMCWSLEAKEAWDEDSTGLAAWKKPTDNECYRQRTGAPAKGGKRVAQPPMCEDGDNWDAAWYVPMKACMHALSTSPARGAEWPVIGKGRLAAVPGWLASEGQGLFGRPIASEYGPDLKHWIHVTRFYAQELGINWAHVRNVMDLNAKYGGFAAALAIKARPQWVLSVVPVSGADTLPIIFERGLAGVYHDWCESFNTYPRTYDLLHIDHLLHLELDRCDAPLLFLELDRILRPGGWLLFRERRRDRTLITKLAESMHWELKRYLNQSDEELHAFQKTYWRP